MFMDDLVGLLPNSVFYCNISNFYCKLMKIWRNIQIFLTNFHNFR